MVSATEFHEVICKIVLSANMPRIKFAAKSIQSLNCGASSKEYSD